MSNGDSNARPARHDFRAFYPHLVATVAAQVGVILVSAATRSMAVWSWVCLLLVSVALAGHTAVVFAPRPPVKDQSSASE